MNTTIKINWKTNHGEYSRAEFIQDNTMSSILPLLADIYNSLGNNEVIISLSYTVITHTKD